MALLLTMATMTAGCAGRSKLHMDTLAVLSRGISEIEVVQRLKKKPVMVLDLADSVKTRVEVFNMVTGTDMQQSTVFLPGVNGAPGHSMTTMTKVDITEPYFLLYRKGALNFWGFLDDFGRSEDPSIRAYRAKVSAAHEEATARRRAALDKDLY